MDYKEYSRLRSIARKRIERASAAGAAEYIRIPTVAEVRASANPGQYMTAVREFLANPSSTLKAAKKEAVSFPKIEIVELPPATKKEPLSDEAKKARRREQKRRSKAKRAVERAATSEKEAHRQAGYLKALESVGAKWREAGVDLGNWIGVLSPKKAKQFVDYMEYRFSQGDFKTQYVIDTFIKDYVNLAKQGYSGDDIKSDFDAFLEKYKQLEINKSAAAEYGLNKDEVWNVWNKFVYGKGLR